MAFHAFIPLTFIFHLYFVFFVPFVVNQIIGQDWQRVSELPAIGRALTGVEKSHVNNE
jgi:hypothetical protein